MAEQQTLPTVDLVQFEGLYTKSNQDLLQPTQLRECKNADFFEQVGSLSKSKGNKRILSSIYREGTAMPIAWCGFYKAVDEAGTLQRQTLIAAGTTIQRVESGGSLTELATGQPNNLARSHDLYDRYMLITSQDPFNVGKKGDFLKYDGIRTLAWGQTAPGDDETVIESFDDSTSFSYSNASGADESNISFKGQSSLKLTTGTGGTGGYAQKGYALFSVNDVIEDRAVIRVYIPRDQYRKLDTSDRCLSIYVGSDGNLTSAYYRYDFRIGQLAFGWNELDLDFASSPSGLAGTTVGVPNDTALNVARYEVITNGASDQAVLYFDQFSTLDQGTPDGSFTDAGGSIFVESSGSVWSYRVSYVDENGLESNGGPESINFSNTASGLDYGSITLTNIPVSPDPKIVARKLYRSVASGNDWLFLATINDNATTTYVDSTPDGSLGLSSPGLPGLFEDFSPPPSAGIVKVWKRTVFLAGDPENPNLLYFSLDENPDAFPLINGFEFDSTITGIYETRMGLVVTTETDYWRVIGDNPDYIVDKIQRKKGAAGFRTVGEARMYGWAHDVDGLRLFDLADTVKLTERIRDRIDALNKDKLREAWTRYSRKHNSIISAYKNASGTYDTYYIYQHLLDDLREGWYYELDLPAASGDFAGLEFLCAEEIEDSSGEFHLYVGGNDGMLYELYPSDSYDWVDADGTSAAVSLELKTPFFRAGLQQSALELQAVSGRAKPILFELRVTEATNLASTWTIKFETADGAGDNQTIRSSKTFDLTFPAGRTLQRVKVDQRTADNLTAAEFMRVTITNEDTGKLLTLTGAKIYLQVLEGQYTVVGDNLGGRG